jgi:hypothetical protein
VLLVVVVVSCRHKNGNEGMTEVVLHVYDVTNSGSGRANAMIQRLNKILRDGMGIGGIFHGAIQVFHSLFHRLVGANKRHFAKKKMLSKFFRKVMKDVHNLFVI